MFYDPRPDLLYLKNCIDSIEERVKKLEDAVGILLEELKEAIAIAKEK